MKLANKWVGVNLPRNLLLAAMVALLVGCGGSSGDSTEVDSDGDGIPDIEDPDDNNDGIDDIDDLNGNGILDSEEDADGDGIPDSEEDTDGDGILDLDDPDDNNDGIDDVDDLNNDGFLDVSDANPCGGEGGSDNDSSNNTWDDNCTLERQITGGQFADSLYTGGMQRVIYCAGFGGGSSVSVFADGEFGELTELALVAYQMDRFPDDTTQHDGIVGPMTWTALRGELELVAEGEFPPGGGNALDSYTVGEADGRCGGLVMFYQEVAPAEGGLGDLLGWTLAESPGSAEVVPFSIGSPFNVIE